MTEGELRQRGRDRERERWTDTEREGNGRLEKHNTAQMFF